MEIIANKVSERFQNFAVAFRHFDTYRHCTLTLGEFKQGIEKIGVKASEEEI
jgi:hypothetical protein